METLLLEEARSNIIVKEYFFCPFLENEQCLSEKKTCPKDRRDKKCLEVEDAFA